VAKLVRGHIRWLRLCYIGNVRRGALVFMQSPPSLIAPFRIAPIFTARVWGFRDLRPWYDKVAESDPIGEVWLTGDDCVVATGQHRGKRLGQLFNEKRDLLVGADFPDTGSPLLIKVIFAREKLSVQVHPDDRMAQKYGQQRGKTECWYALAAEPGAQVAVGLKPGTTLGAVRKGIQAGALEESLNLLPVHAGDMIFVDAGTVHAIWPGSILLETQQNCDITYRMYDYGRPRELHVEKSLEATKLSTRAGRVEPQELEDRTLLIDTDYFRVERFQVTNDLHGERLRRGGEVAGLTYLFTAAGTGQLTGASFETVELVPGSIACVPAGSPEYAVENVGGASPSLDLILISPNRPRQTA
jgi:mannose-6-phosphate isomerase